MPKAPIPPVLRNPGRRASEGDEAQPMAPEFGLKLESGDRRSYTGSARHDTVRRFERAPRRLRPGLALAMRRAVSALLERFRSTL